MPGLLDELPVRRVVAVVGSDLGLARSLAAATSGRALSLVDPGLAGTPAVGALWPYAGPGQVAANNAEVLLLAGHAAAEVARFGRWRHAWVVAWSTESVPAAVVARAGAALAVATGRARFAGRARIGRHTFCLLANRRRATPRHGRFFSPVLGVDGFLGALRDAGVRYVVLRWFDALPEVPPGQDLDLLVANADLPTVECVLNALPGVLPVDVYTVSGLPGTDYRGGPYYPPAIAERLLEGRRLLHGRYAIPSPQDAFLALAFHAVYHKGETSGLARRAGELPRVATTKHDYVAALISQAETLGMSVEPTLTGLDEMLDKRGWRPPSEMLARMTVNGLTIDQLLALPKWRRWLVRARHVARRQGQRLRRQGFIRPLHM